LISHTVPARVGILGNPSDGYGGRTLALAVPRFAATVNLEPAPRLEIVAAAVDEPVWGSVSELISRVDREGYGTGPQLLTAAVRTFANVVATQVDKGLAKPGFPDETFRLTYGTTIPRQVGLAGSSALVVAALRCLAHYTDIDIPDEVLPSIALAVETEQLGLTAGLQDRVVQTYGGLVAMDFGEMMTDARFGVAHGDYQRVEPDHLPPLFLAYRTSAAGPSDQFHRVLRQRFEAGDSTVRDVLHHLAGLALEGQAALRWKDPDRFASLMGENMRLRRQLGTVPESQLELVDVADALDAPATFAGSGGAVVGAYADDGHYERLAGVMDAVGARIVRIEPVFETEHDEGQLDLGL
jgi:glucuronokinase